MATDNPDASAIVTELSQEAKLKLEIIESLLEPCDRTL
jgi:putative transposase